MSFKMLSATWCEVPQSRCPLTKRDDTNIDNSKEHRTKGGRQKERERDTLCEEERVGRSVCEREKERDRKRERE